MGGRLQETASKVELLCVLADCMNNHATNADNVGGGDHPAARVPDEPPPEAFASERLVDGQARQGYHGNGMRHIPAESAHCFCTGDGTGNIGSAWSRERVCQYV